MKNYLDYFVPKYLNTPGPLPEIEERNGIYYINGRVVGEKPVSGKDPLLSLWVEGEALALPLKGLGLLGKAGWKGLSKVAPKVTGAVETGISSISNAAKQTVSSALNKVTGRRSGPNLALKSFDNSMRIEGNVSDDTIKQIADLRKRANIKEIESSEEFNRLLNLGYSEDQAIDLMSKMSTSALKAPTIIEQGTKQGIFGMYHPNEHTVSLYNFGKGSVENLASTVDHEWGAHAATRGVLNKAEAKAFNIPYGKDFGELLERNSRLLGGQEGMTSEIQKIISHLNSAENQLEALRLAQLYFGEEQIKNIDDLFNTLTYGMNPLEIRARMWVSRMKQNLTGEDFITLYNDPFLQLQDMGWLRKFYNLPNLLNYYKYFGAGIPPAFIVNDKLQNESVE